MINKESKLSWNVEENPGLELTTRPWPPSSAPILLLTYRSSMAEVSGEGGLQIKGITDAVISYWNSSPPLTREIYAVFWGQLFPKAEGIYSADGVD